MALRLRFCWATAALTFRNRLRGLSTLMAAWETAAADDELPPPPPDDDVWRDEEDVG